MLTRLQPIVTNLYFILFVTILAVISIAVYIIYTLKNKRLDKKLKQIAEKRARYNDPKSEAPDCWISKPFDIRRLLENS